MGNSLKRRPSASWVAKALLAAGVTLGVLTVAATALGPDGASRHSPSAREEAPGPQPAQTSPPGAGGAAMDANDIALALEGAVPIESIAGVQPPAEEARANSGSRFTMPLLAWSGVTDRYGAPRGKGLVHGGIDLALDDHHRASVYAACTGSVLTADYSSTYGNHVVVDCGDGWTTLYAHFSATSVVPGEAVTPSSVLGVSGSTGYSTGEHLHFEIRWQGVPVNPEDYLDFHIAPGTPLSSGPIVFGGRGGAGSNQTTDAGGAPTADTTEAPPTATATATATPKPPTPTPTPTATPTPTPTPRPPTPTRTPTPRPVMR